MAEHETPNLVVVVRFYQDAPCSLRIKANTLVLHTKNGGSIPSGSTND